MNTEHQPLPRGLEDKPVLRLPRRIIDPGAPGAQDEIDPQPPLTAPDDDPLCDRMEEPGAGGFRFTVSPNAAGGKIDGLDTLRLTRNRVKSLLHLNVRQTVCGITHEMPGVRQDEDEKWISDPPLCVTAGGTFDDIVKLIAKEVLNIADLSTTAASIEITCSGWYRVFTKGEPKPLPGYLSAYLTGQQAAAAIGAEVTLEPPVIGGLSITRSLIGTAAAALRVDLDVEPFKQIVLTLAAWEDERDSGSFKIEQTANKFKRHGSTEDLTDTDHDDGTLEPGKKYRIRFKVLLKAAKSGAAYAHACLKRFGFDIYSIDP